MVIKLWTNFTKRKNSTLIPISGSGIEDNAVLKEETSIQKPSFIINTPATEYTYVYAFGHYYFVDDVISLDAHRSEIVCSMDVLASYRSAILSYPAFVERSASMYDVYVNDPLLSQKQLLASEAKHSTSLSTFFSQTGCFIVECMAKDKGIVLYATSNLDPYKYILTPAAYSNTDISDWIQSTISQSFDLDVYIGGVKWMPFTASGMGTLLSNTFPIGPVDIADTLITAGYSWTYSIYQVAQSGPSSHKSTSVSLSLPTAGNFNDFRDCHPSYTQYNLYLPGVGVVNLDPAVIGYAIHQNKTIYVDIWVDLVSGEITYRLRLGANASNIGRYSGNISVDVPIGRSAVDVTKSAKMVGGSIAAGAAAGGWVGALAGAAVGAVEAIHNAMTPDTSMIGGAGNKAELANVVGSLQLTRKQFGAKEFPTPVAGRPLMQNVVLGNLYGFCKCGNASVPVNAADPVRQEINNMLNTGFYIE